VKNSRGDLRYTFKGKLYQNFTKLYRFTFLRVITRDFEAHRGRRSPQLRCPPYQGGFLIPVIASQIVGAYDGADSFADAM